MNESKMQVIDTTIVVFLFVVGCILGKLCMEAYDTWLSFNLPSISVLFIGELIWVFLRKRVVHMGEQKKEEGENY